MRHKYFALMLLASALCGCKTRQGLDDGSSAGNVIQGNEDKMEYATVSREDRKLAFTVTASVSPRPDGYSEVGAPFGGRVTRIPSRLGDRVHKGQTLFEMSSPDFMAAVKDYLESQNAYSLASANLNRKTSLREAGVVSEREWEEARREAADAETSLTLARQVLSVFGVDPGSVRMGQPMRVISPISGVVVQNNLVLGQLLSEDSESLVAVADLSRVWVTANVRENAARGLAKGQTASVIPSSGDPVTGTIFYVGDILDEKTRTIPVVIECANPDKALKPGMFVSAGFGTERKGVIAIPSTAVFQGAESQFVYVRKDDKSLEKRQVKTETLEKGQSLVLEGLEEGETILVSGGIYLAW